MKISKKYFRSNIADCIFLSIIFFFNRHQQPLFKNLNFLRKKKIVNFFFFAVFAIFKRKWKLKSACFHIFKLSKSFNWLGNQNLFIFLSKKTFFYLFNCCFYGFRIVIQKMVKWKSIANSSLTFVLICSDNTSSCDIVSNSICFYNICS